jgi:recombination protein RecA
MMAKTKAKKPKVPQRPAGVTAEDFAKLTALIAGLEKEHGEGILTTLTSAPAANRYERQTPTGSIGLDIAIGPMKRLADGRWQTGRPRGAVTEIFGPEGSGKTTLTLLSIANCQALGGRCAMLDQEHSLDPLYAKKLGVNMETLYWSQPSSGDQCLQIAEKLIKSGLFDLVVIDSVAALVPKTELAGEVGDHSVGAQARLMSQFFRMITIHMGKDKMCDLILTNQIRFKIGVRFGSPETTPGGNALKFAASFRLDVRRTKAIKLGGGEVDDDSDPQVIGHRMRVKVIKNKVAPPFRVAEFSLIYGQGIDTIEELADLCILHGIIEQNGAWYTLPSGTKFQGKGDPEGRSGLVPAMRSDQTLCYQLYDKLLTRNMATLGCHADGSPMEGVFTGGMPTMHAQFEPPTEDEKAEADASEEAPPEDPE